MIKQSEFPNDSRESHVFISYSRKDSKIADWICRQIAAGGFEVWIDRRDIPGGEAWADTIKKAIVEAEALIVMLSPDSIESREVLREIEIAHQKNIRIIPILIRQVELPDRFKELLSSLQRITYWRRKQACVVDLINSLGGLRGVASIMPKKSTVALRENARLIVELLRIAQEVSFGNVSLIFLGGEEWRYYIQFLACRDSSEIYVEAVGNVNIQEEYQISEEKIEKLKKLGWQSPTKKSAGNYWRIWQVHTNRDRATVAANVMNTFLEVYDHYWGEHIILNEIDLQ